MLCNYEIFFNTQQKFRISERPYACNSLYLILTLRCLFVLDLKLLEFFGQESFCTKNSASSTYWANPTILTVSFHGNTKASGSDIRLQHRRLIAMPYASSICWLGINKAVLPPRKYKYNFYAFLYLSFCGEIPGAPNVNFRKISVRKTI